MPKGQAPLKSAFAFMHGKPIEHFPRLRQQTELATGKVWAWKDFWLNEITVTANTQTMTDQIGVSAKASSKVGI